MDRSTNHSVLLIWSVLVMIFLVGCETTKIGDINRDPGRYAGKDITISGQATESFGVLNEGAFEVDDGTGRIWVLSEGFGVPGKGAHVTVTGRVQSGVAFAGRSFGTVLRQTQRHH